MKSAYVYRFDACGISLFMLPTNEEGAVMGIVWSQHNSFREVHGANENSMSRCVLHNSPDVAGDVISRPGKCGVYRLDRKTFVCCN